MNKLVGIALLILGIVLIVYGINAADSISSEFKEFFSGTPTKESVWLLVGGVVLAAIGAASTFRAVKHT